MREVERCEATYGEGAACYPPGEAWRLSALLAALVETYRAVQQCAAEGAEP